MDQPKEVYQPLAPETPSNQPEVSAVQAVPATPSTKNRKLIIIIASLIFLVVLTGLFAWLYLANQNKVSSTWKGVKPGVTTKEEVIKKLGKPIKEGDLPYSKALYYSSGNELFPNTVVLDEGGKVKSILVQVSPAEEIKLSAWLKKYGQPEKEMWNSYDAWTKTYINPTKGIAVVASKEADRVVAIHYFASTSLAEYLKIWGGNLFEKNPYVM